MATIAEQVMAAAMKTKAGVKAQNVDELPKRFPFGKKKSMTAAVSPVPDVVKQKLPRTEETKLKQAVPVAKTVVEKLMNVTEKRGRGQPQKYASAAERQAAYRARKRGEKS